MEQEVISGQNNIRMTRIEKLTDLADLGVNPYPYLFHKDGSAKYLQEK